VKEIDFLPEWYLDGKRRRVHMRRQYAALTIVFLGMLAYNLTSAHRIGRATAEVAALESRRGHAENATVRFDRITQELSDHQAKVNLLKEMDSRIDPAALVAEISHLIGERVVLSRVEFISEPVVQKDATSARNGSAVRVANRSGDSSKPTKLGDVKFRIVLAGVAASSDDVGTLVIRLEESSYFRQAYFSFSRNNTIEVAASTSRVETEGHTRTSPVRPKQTLQVSEFEITCYLANYEEIEKG